MIGYRGAESHSAHKTVTASFSTAHGPWEAPVVARGPQTLGPAAEGHISEGGDHGWADTVWSQTEKDLLLNLIYGKWRKGGTSQRS